MTSEISDPQIVPDDGMYCDDEEAALEEALSGIMIDDNRMLSDVVDIDGLSYMILSTLSHAGYRITSAGKCKGYRPKNMNEGESVNG